jgi:hypothetical protein
LRWALLEATMHALRRPAYAERYQRTKRRLGKQRGAKVAQVDIARHLAHALWHMLLEVRSSLHEAPLLVWRHRSPFWTCARERSIQFRLVLPLRQRRQRTQRWTLIHARVTAQTTDVGARRIG